MKIKNPIASKLFLTRKAPLFVLVIFTFLLIGYFYGPVLFHPSEFLLNDHGDALKNYFCYEWHVQHDVSFLDYTGSNYPYGENHLYTDGTPILSNLIKSLPFLKPYSIALFNLTMLFSLIVCAVLLFKIFELFNVAKLNAVVSSFGIMVLCPQVLRYTGHFALSYGFCIPLIIYLVLRFYVLSVNKTKGAAIIGFTLLCLFFIHPYIGMICSSLVLFYCVIDLLANLSDFKKRSLCFLLQGVLPVLVYFLIVKIADTHTDRVAKPYGFFYSIANIETVFISTHKPFRHLLSQLYKITIQNGEGIAYIGLTSILVMFLLPLVYYYHKSRIVSAIKENLLLRNYLYLFFSSLVLLLFAMGYPFKFGWSFILDSFPVIQQFRAPGRFAWVFYFIVTIASCIVIDKFFLVKMNRFVRSFLVISLLLLYTIEGIPYHNEVAKKTYPVNLFNKSLLNNELKQVIDTIKKLEAQAIIPLPFFHIGTDYYNISGTEKISNLAFVVAYHTQIPLLANLTPRNSLTEAEKLIQVVGSDLINKEIKQDIKSAKPFVVLYNKEFLLEEEINLLSKAEAVLETPTFIVKKISSKKLFVNLAHEKRLAFKSARNKMLKIHNYYFTDSSFFTFLNYDGQPDQRYQGNVNEPNLLFEISPNKLKKDKLYEVSFWYQAKDRLDMNNLLVVSEVLADGSKKNISEKNVYSMLNVKHGKTLASLTFTCTEPERLIRISLEGKSDRERVFYLDDFMVREKGIDVYRLHYSKSRKDSVLYFNNFELSP